MQNRLKFVSAKRLFRQGARVTTVTTESASAAMISQSPADGLKNPPGRMNRPGQKDGVGWYGLALMVPPPGYSRLYSLPLGFDSVNQHYPIPDTFV
jgi:hypothetical protein